MSGADLTHWHTSIPSIPPPKPLPHTAATLDRLVLHTTVSPSHPTSPLSSQTTRPYRIKSLQPHSNHRLPRPTLPPALLTLSSRLSDLPTTQTEHNHLQSSQLLAQDLIHPPTPCSATHRSSLNDRGVSMASREIFCIAWICLVGWRLLE